MDSYRFECLGGLGKKSINQTDKCFWQVRHKETSILQVTTGSKEMKSKFSADTSVKEAFLQVVLDTKSTDDNKLQADFE